MSFFSFFFSEQPKANGRGSQGRKKGGGGRQLHGEKVANNAVREVVLVSPDGKREAAGQEFPLGGLEHTGGEHCLLPAVKGWVCGGGQRKTRNKGGRLISCDVVYRG